MDKKTLKKKYLRYVKGLINDFSYHDIDCFCENNDLTEEETNYLLSLDLTVTILE
jgi:hypothetical protein